MKGTSEQNDVAPLNVVVVDDEAHARELVRALIERYTPFARLVGEAATALDGIARIQALRPHVVLLDIEMPNGNAFDLLAAFPERCFEVIYTTAHERYAVQAIRTHPADYLLKPLEPERFLPALQALHQRLASPTPSTILQVHTTQGHFFLPHVDITHVDADGSYSHVHLLNGERHTMSRPIGHLIHDLPHPSFFRCHHSHLLNLRHVKALLNADGGLAELVNGTRVPVATRKQAELLHLLATHQRSVPSAG
ncbi:MAG: response regulator [Flavobacteriales bacterium]|nr:response regulator [Flavobacteriales bacterium]